MPEAVGDVDVGDGEPAGLESVAVRAARLSDAVRTLNWAIGAAGGLLLVGVALLVFGNREGGTPIFVPVGEGGALVEPVRMDRMPASESETASWLASALIETFDFHWGNLSSALSRSTQRYFTEAGGAQFVAALDQAGVIEAVRGNRGFSRMALEGNPMPGEFGVASGRAWQQWEVFGVLEIVGARDLRGRRYLITVVVRRAQRFERESGLVIDSVVLEQA